MSEYIACETCLYKKNCQFLAKHKRTVVSDCTAYENAADMVMLCHGYWVPELSSEAPLYACSECHKLVYTQHPYCPHCGAVMDGKGDCE